MIAFVEKPPTGEAPTDLINAGTYVLEPSVLDRIADGRQVSVEREVFPALVDDRSLFALDGETYWIDTGTPETYIQAQLDLTEGLRGEPVPAVAPSAAVHADAVVRRSVVGPDAVVEAGARVEGAVLLAGAAVRAGAVGRGIGRRLRRRGVGGRPPGPVLRDRRPPGRGRRRSPRRGEAAGRLPPLTRRPPCAPW